MNKKRVLLTGASGKVGFETFKELLRRSHQYKIRIFNLDRKFERKLFKPYKDKVEIVWGDLRSASLVEKAINGVDVILHVAALIPPAADIHPDLAWEINVGGTKNILNAIKKQARPPKLLFTSSISVYGDRLTNPEISVGDSLNPSDGDEYARTKIEAEKQIRLSDLTWTIFRLSGILYPGMKIQALMFHMPLDTSLEFCHNTDTGFALASAIENHQVWGNTYNLGGGPRCRTTARDFLNEMMPIFGVNPKAIPAYAFATRNFHSGYYKDGNILDEILHFQRHSLEDYFNMMRTSISPTKRFFIRCIPSPVVKAWMLHMSEPFKAIRENNHELIKRFYGSKKVFERIFQKAEQRTFA